MDDTVIDSSSGNAAPVPSSCVRLFWKFESHGATSKYVSETGKACAGSTMPKARSAVHPALRSRLADRRTFFSLFAFGLLFGFVGLLIAVPAAAAVGVLVGYAIERYRASAMYRGELPTSCRTAASVWWPACPTTGSQT